MKKPSVYSGDRVKVSESFKIPTADYPVFSFRHLVSGYTIDDCLDKQERSDLLGKLSVMSQKTWSILDTSDHLHGGGFEKIPRKKIKTPLPAIMTEDIDKLYVMRFNGLSSRIIGFRSQNVYHVTHIDTKLSAYNH